ncbi:hypothetical protein [Myxosarcina sp. GI1]|uniref:hypothetical protein n=1 Tax=Myxosarcina sp. GI1 TaxID=1541065 RepID=UPI00056CD875|nr:hypothetical protein [Myxosarcina sp. GI1]
MPKESKFGKCPFCKRDVNLTFHHLIPKKMHRREYFKKKYSKECLNEGIDICRLCHNGIHDLYDEMRLAKEFNSVDILKQDKSLQKHFSWVGKQKVRA